MAKEANVILLRHGESEWNKDNRFCGWVNVGLSDIGLTEAENAAKAIHDSGIVVTKVFTSLLKRANQTVDKIAERIAVSEDIIQRDWRLNERHYGALTGLNKGIRLFICSCSIYPISSRLCKKIWTRSGSNLEKIL